MKISKRFFLFILLPMSSTVYSQSDVVECPPSNFTATAGIESAHLSWDNPGFYYGTPELSTGDSSYFTGTVDNISGELTENSKIRSVNEEVGWATFDISNLPPGQEPLSVEFNFYVYETNWPYWCVTPVSSNPLTTDPQELYTDIIEGYGSYGSSDYGTFDEGSGFSAGQYSYQLIGSVLEDIANTADTSSWFTIGIVDYDFVESGEYYISLEGWDEPNPPTLTVTYGDGQRVVTPAVPAPGISSAEISEYKNNILSGEQEAHEPEKHEVNIELSERTEDDCSSAWSYHVVMDGDTIAYTSNRELTVFNLTIGQEYCFYAIAEFREFDSLGVLVETTYSAPSDTSCISPVEFLLCPPEDFSSIHTYSVIELLWTPPFTGGVIEHWGAEWNMIPLPEILEVRGVAAGNSHIAYLHSDSTVSIWPEGGWLQPGPEINHDVIQVTAGGNFTLGLRSDSTVFGYGWSDSGQGDPPDNLDQVVAIEAGYEHSLALLADSTVVAWGNNANGQTDVPDTLERVVAISAGYAHSLVLFSNGTVMGWGADNWGEEQDSIANSLTNVVSIAAGSEHNIALKSDGTVVAWGLNGYGQLDVPENLSNVVEIAAGYYHNLALQLDGHIIGWGSNNNGQIQGPGFEEVVKIAAGWNFSLALRADSGSDCGVLLGYTIFQDGDSVGTTLDHGYSVLDAEWDQEYCYNVMARYTQGNSALSDTICTSLITPVFCPPNNFVADSDYDMVYLDWYPYDGTLCGSFLGYAVYQDDVLIDTVTVSEYEIPNLSYETDYCFYVTALYGEGESAATDTICISRITPQLCLPGNVGVEPGDNELMVSWQAPYSALTSTDLQLNDKRSDETENSRSEIISQENVDDDCGSFLGYIIYVNGDSAAFVADSVTSFTVEGLENGEEHCVTMSTLYAQGESPQSDELCAIPFAVRRDHYTGILQVTITNEGNIGYTNSSTSPDSLDIDSVGLGFVYINTNYLYEGGLMVGTDPDHISDCIRNDTDGWTQDEDFIEAEDTYLYLDTAHALANEVGVVSLRDDGAENPLGVRIEQRSYADDSFELRNGTIFHYTIINEGNSDLTGLYAGLFVDWDIEDHVNNSAHYSADYRMVYAQDQEGNPSHFAGLLMLNQGLGMNMSALNNNSDGVYLYSNDEKWSHMTSGVNDGSVLNADVSNYVGVGPVDIAYGDSISFGIATLAANSIYELEYVAGELHAFWETNFPEELGFEDEAILPIEFAMHQNYPNPFNPVTSVRYDIPTTSNVTITVYSLLGQKVKTLTSSVHQPGFYSTQWNGTNDMGSAVSSGVYICKINSDRYTAIKKMILMK